MDRFRNLGVIKNKANYNASSLDNFVRVINKLRGNKAWEKASIVELFHQIIPDFDHNETGKYLDNRM